MQLNNLVIIPIPYPTPNTLTIMHSIPLSPTKALGKPADSTDDLSWKKSLSAFKKFKGKKDKDTKSGKNSLSKIPFLEQEKPTLTLNTNFSLVENDIKFSLLTCQGSEQIKIEETLDYFDPNKAPFFQFGATYQFSQTDGMTQVKVEQQEPLKLTKRNSVTPKLKKEPSKREKSKPQDPGQDPIFKTQKSHSSQNPKVNEPKLASDPFIILKAPQFHQKQSSSSQPKSQPKKCEESKKTKPIKKRSKYTSVPSSIYPRDIYSRSRSEYLSEPASEQNDQKSLGYGNDELPIIEFDFGMSIKLSRQGQSENGTDNLPIYQIKDTSVVRSRIRPFINSTEILQEYEFNPEFITEEGMIQPKEQIEINNQEGLEKA